MITISELNAMDKVAFMEVLGSIYEHSPWVAERVASGRPFSTLEQLSDQMRLAVDSAAMELKLGLIRAHPDLAGKLATGEKLTDASASEQAGAGLDRLDDDEFKTFTDLNAQYREKFGFPFIICVRKTDKSGILRSFRSRLKNSPDQEKSAALTQIHDIAGLRLKDLVVST